MNANLQTWLFILIIASFSINSCCTKGDTYIKLDENYIPDYEEGDMLIFKNKKGDFDTLYVVKTSVGYDEKLNKDFCGTSEYIQAFGCLIDSISEYSDNSIFHVRTFDVNNIEIVFNKSRFSTRFSYGTDTADMYLRFDEIEVEDFVYTEVFQFFDNNPKDTLLYDKKYGIIQFRSKEDVWNLIHKN